MSETSTVITLSYGDRACAWPFLQFLRERGHEAEQDAAPVIIIRGSVSPEEAQALWSEWKSKAVEEWERSNFSVRDRVLSGGAGD